MKPLSRWTLINFEKGRDLRRQFHDQRDCSAGRDNKIASSGHFIALWSKSVPGSHLF